MHNKRDSHRTTVSFGEGILLLMGCSQNYIMYWGLQLLLYTNPVKSLPKHFFIWQMSLCIITTHFQNITYFLLFIVHIRQNTGYFLKSTTFQVAHKVHIEFPHIERIYVFPVKIYDISVGNSPAALRFQVNEVGAPFE